MPDGTVLQFDKYQRASSSTSGDSLNASPNQSFPISFESRAATHLQSTAVLKSYDLYPTLEAKDGEVILALQLLGECIAHLEKARKIDAQADYIEFDEAMMRARQILRELFGLRQIGDGFGATINGILWALKNYETGILTRRQISLVIESLGQLRMKPILNFDSAMVLLDQLEEADLDLEPSFIDVFAEINV